MTASVPRLASLALLSVGCSTGFTLHSVSTFRRTSQATALQNALSSTGDYLSVLSAGITLHPAAPTQAPAALALPPAKTSKSTAASKPSSITLAKLDQPTPPTLTKTSSSHKIEFQHAPLSYFHTEHLTWKGPRSHPDKGDPHDATRPFTTIPATSPSSTSISTKTGSWYCTTGGWPSPKRRPTTEWFLVLSGSGAVTDTDRIRHPFEPGDTVVLPKGWSGRWDVVQDIHKIWVVHDHDRVEEKHRPIRAEITKNYEFHEEYMTDLGVHPHAIHGTPRIASLTTYQVGPTKAGCMTCTPGSVMVKDQCATESIHVFEGVFVLTNEDGSARRCGKGDTVVLERGWNGVWDVIEKVRLLWVVTDFP